MEGNADISSQDPTECKNQCSDSGGFKHFYAARKLAQGKFRYS